MKTLQDKPDFEKLEDEFNNYILSPYTTKVSASTMAHFLWFKNKLTEFHKAASSRTEGLQKEIEELNKVINNQRITLSKQYDVMQSAQELIHHLRTGEEPISLDFKFQKATGNSLDKYDVAIRELNQWTQKQMKEQETNPLKTKTTIE